MLLHPFHNFLQDYRIVTARKMSVDIDATPDLLLLIQQKLRIVQYRYGGLSKLSVVIVTLPLQGYYDLGLRLCLWTENNTEYAVM